MLDKLRLVVKIVLCFLKKQGKLNNCIYYTKTKTTARNRQLNKINIHRNTYQPAKWSYCKADCSNQMLTFLFWKQNLRFLCCGPNGRNIAIAFIVIVEQIICCNTKQLADLQYVLCIGKCCSVFPTTYCLPWYIQFFCKIFLWPTMCFPKHNYFIL